MVTRTHVLSRSVPVFVALGDETRLKLLSRLSAGGPQSIAGLTAGSKITRQAITKHLLVLADAGLVRRQRYGRESRWSLQPERLEVARGYIDFISEEWTKRLQALTRHLDTMP
jgi:DNA-binding transcriptional ArsR family regulator